MPSPYSTCYSSFVHCRVGTKNFISSRKSEKLLHVYCTLFRPNKAVFKMRYLLKAKILALPLNKHLLLKPRFNADRKCEDTSMFDAVFSPENM